MTRGSGELPLRVAFDVTPSLVSRSGVGRYALELEAALSAHESVQLERLASTSRPPTTQLGPRVARGLRRELLYYPRSLRRRARRVGADLVHCPGPFPARCARPPLVLTLHDALAWRFPELFTPVNALHQRLLMTPAARRAARVITSSTHSARELTELVGIDPARIAVTPLGVHQRFRPMPTAPGDLDERFDISTPYVLTVGTLEPRKNLVSAIRAFEHASRSGATANHRLVIVGGRGWRNAELDRALHAVTGSVTLTGHVDDDDLVRLYSGASCLVYPSLYEGFGLPPLEAMACGTPVITSNTTSLPEVAGDAALLVDPHDVEAIAGAITRLLTEPDVARELRVRGLARARQLTWSRCAEGTVDVYRDVLTETS